MDRTLGANKYVRRLRFGRLLEVRIHSLTCGGKVGCAILVAPDGTETTVTAFDQNVERLRALPEDCDVEVYGYERPSIDLCADTPSPARFTMLAAQPALVLRDIPAEKLRRMVWQAPISSLVPRFRVSDQAIRKRCRRLQIATPPRGFWARVNAGHLPYPNGVPQA